MFNKLFVLLFLAFALPVFSQEVDTVSADSVIIRLWGAMSEEEKSAAVKGFLHNRLEENPKMYYDGVNKLRAGIILTSVSSVVIPFGSMLSSVTLDNSREYGVWVFSLPALTLVNIVTFTIGVRFMVVGRMQKKKYRPQMVVAPNGVGFTMNF